MKTLSGLELPLDVDESNASPGYTKLVARADGVYRKGHGGDMHKLFEWDDPTVFVQPTQPVYEGKYIWIQTNVNGNANDFTFWFEDGVN